MKNLITELLLKLAQKEEESQDLAAQVATLERVIMEMLRNMAANEQQTLIRQIEGALAGVSQMPAFLTTMQSAGENLPKTC
ncbi:MULTISPECIES: sigma-S stabilization anti-adapter protein IraP [unclassified Citrobacter]|uniref:sigma-S stabilization anti-adapter protein IraP n=1 Tax=unclassified Citrobacter TaxID=2644389 RepID=UPI00107BF68E|nr:MULTISPECIES: sigma-S stabilization anti-adapter protein IraP [unclassified Citrobacter]MDA8496564.1 anti-RssB factor [Citrobacter sp. Igbk 17]MDA8500992.1 anti-RssB factor [Citrobacter sp. Awk 2]MDA8512011.1 anti-RssB factor [Citrobacter sp. Igbk 14]MDA8518233.1 anti-RssB factor [Citrobacter sp. Igbk 16]MEB2418390.1 sigma-S stabilization anti-adapter protein IraP [Citrobacter sp. R-1.5.2]